MPASPRSCSLPSHLPDVHPCPPKPSCFPKPIWPFDILEWYLPISQARIWRLPIAEEYACPMSTLAKRIKSLRTGKGLTQSELARMTGIDQAEISRIEQGTRRISTDDLEKSRSSSACRRPTSSVTAMPDPRAERGNQGVPGQGHPARRADRARRRCQSRQLAADHAAGVSDPGERRPAARRGPGRLRAAADDDSGDTVHSICA
jgi:transcriptional regulator with XRE-family HTH domain